MDSCPSIPQILCCSIQLSIPLYGFEGEGGLPLQRDQPSFNSIVWIHICFRGIVEQFPNFPFNSIVWILVIQSNRFNKANTILSIPLYGFLKALIWGAKTGNYFTFNSIVWILVLMSSNLSNTITSAFNSIVWIHGTVAPGGDSSLNYHTFQFHCMDSRLFVLPHSH